MKELPCLEEIYDFETEQLEKVFNDLEAFLSSNPTLEQLPRGFESVEKFQRKALKLKESIELELEERKQVDDVISFFVQKTKTDFLNDDQFYQPAAPTQKQPISKTPKQQEEEQKQLLQLNAQNLAMLKHQPQHLDQNASTLPPSSTFDGNLSDIHSSISKQIYNQRTGPAPSTGGSVSSGMKNKKDLQAFMREKLAKTKISSEATSNIQPIAQNTKNFVKPKKEEDTGRPSLSGGVRASTPSDKTQQQSSFYKPNLKSTKESSNFVSGNPSTSSGTKSNARGNSKKPSAKKDMPKLNEPIGNCVVVNAGANIYRPPIKKPQSKQQVKHPTPVQNPIEKQKTTAAVNKSTASQVSTQQSINKGDSKILIDDLGQWSDNVPSSISSLSNDIPQQQSQTDEVTDNNPNEEIESKYSDEEVEPQMNSTQLETNQSSDHPPESHQDQSQVQDNSQEIEAEEDEEQEEEEKQQSMQQVEDQEDQDEDDQEEGFYSELGATQPPSQLEHLNDINSTDDDHHYNYPSNQVSSQEQKQTPAVIRGKVQLIVDDAAVQLSALTTPRDANQQNNVQILDQDNIETEKQNNKKEEPIVVVAKQPQVSKTLELIKKITNQSQEETEEAKQKRKEEQEERLKNIREMIDKEQKQKEDELIKSKEQQKTDKEETPTEKDQESKASDPSKKQQQNGNKPKTSKKKPAAANNKTSISDYIGGEVNGIVIKDYTPYYKSFYEIFVGGFLEPKTFDLQFTVRDTRNTYAQFVSLMQLDTSKKKYQFEQAPLEKSHYDYYSQMPNFFTMTGKAFDGESLMRQAMAQAELKDRYQQIKQRDITEILKDASEIAASAPQQSDESSLYYRVVKNRTEVYDIISRSFSRKRQWNELPHGLDLRNSWNLLWTWSKIKIDISRLLVWQRCNHFSGAKNVSRKDFLKRNIEMAMRLSPKAAQVFNISPLTFILPKEYVNFLECFSELEDKEGKYNYWIMKPAAKSRGRGISLVNDLSQISYGEPIVVQRYIKNPLLINGYKFDCRIYVLVTSVNPLEAFLYKDGFGRFSTIPFSLDPNDKNNKYIHLTNVSIQKYNSSNNEYTTTEEGQSDALYGGTKISIPTLKKRVHQATGVSWDEAIWPQVREVIVKTLVACQNDIQYNPCSFELFGYDILVDSDLKCWLIEVNSSPSLARDTILDDMVKSKLIDDIIDLVDPLDFDRKRLFEVLERRINEDFKGGGIQTGATSKKNMNRDLTYILNGRLPRKYGEMPQKMGNFERIAPSPQCDQWMKLIGGQKMFGSMMKIQQQTEGKKPVANVEQE